jgi:hypothetical protein
MVASLGSGVPPFIGVPIERHPVVNVHTLHRDGQIPPNATSIALAIDGGAPVTIGIFRDYKPQYGYGASQPGFLCPRCSARVWRLYVKGVELGCRHCFKLDYASRHISRWSPDIRRAIKIRRKLGADPHPFGPIPPRPVGSGRAMYDRLIVELVACEERILAVVGHINAALERRTERQRGR